MKKIIDGFLTTFTTVCRIPLRLSFKTEYGGISLFLAPIGILVGLLAAGAWLLGLRLIGDRFLAAIAVLAVQYLCFNLFHFDGLLDSADALLRSASREKRLEILRDPRIGSFAFFAGFLYLLAKHYLIMRCAPRGLHWPMLAAVFAYPAAGRAAAVLVPCFLKPARAEGLGAALVPWSLARAAAGIALSLALILCLLAALGFHAAGARGTSLIMKAGLAFLLSAAAAAALVVPAYGRGVGGFTGDALGAAVEAGELLYLVFIMRLTAG